jgi:putative ubiquitin-RnfH superfamily antitoxin RatB of RatAB toxin-antitoxin module
VSQQLDIEVAYAQRIVRLSVAEGTCVLDAIRGCGLLLEFPEIDLGVNAVGIWGKPVALERLLRQRDRVEIYRPLQVDPKQARRGRARQQPKAKRGR